LAFLVGGPDTAALNAGGGLMMAMPYSPLSFEQYVDALTGGPADSPAGDALQRELSVAAMATGTAGAGWFGLESKTTGSKTLGARLAEVLHLKLMALLGAVTVVRGAVQATQVPLLNVGASSFRVRCGEGHVAVPLWWTARVSLVQPAEAVELPLPTTQAKYYVAGRGGGMSIYSPGTAGRAAQGRGWLRLRNVVTETAGGVVLEGTLATQERIQAGSNDLLWLRFGVGPSRLDLYAVVDSQQAMAAGEIRIRTQPSDLPAEVVSRLKTALGVPIQDVNFEMVPLLSTPCDMYALAVLAVRTLLVDGKRPLPMALDDMLSLAVQSGRGAGEGVDLAHRIGIAFETDSRFVESLGPHRLLFDCDSSKEAFEAIPPRLWYKTLACVVRMFTGLGPDAICRDFGDAPPGGIQKVFDPVLADMYSLLVGCRTLIVSDQALRQELRGVINGCLATVRR
jgi:hypothetical protein